MENPGRRGYRFWRLARHPLDVQRHRAGDKVVRVPFREGRRIGRPMLDKIDSIAGAVLSGGTAIVPMTMPQISD